MLLIVFLAIITSGRDSGNLESGANVIVILHMKAGARVCPCKVYPFVEAVFPQT